MSRIHFEIGKENLETHETSFVYSGDTFKEVLQIWKEQGYSSPEYFIDVWETDKEGTPYPLTDIKVDDFMLQHYTI